MMGDSTGAVAGVIARLDAQRAAGQIDDAGYARARARVETIAAHLRLRRELQEQARARLATAYASLTDQEASMESRQLAGLLADLLFVLDLDGR